MAWRSSVSRVTHCYESRALRMISCQATEHCSSDLLPGRQGVAVGASHGLRTSLCPSAGPASEKKTLIKNPWVVYGLGRIIRRLPSPLLA